MPALSRTPEDIVETTPLLVDGETTSTNDVERQSLSKAKKEITPLPKKQIFVLCWMRFSEPVSFNLIFPFINEMLVSVGITNPGYYSGLIEGVFAFTQLCTVFYWGSLSDRIGRKPVLLLGLAGAALFTCLFGLSTSFGMILISRMLIGIFNGNVAVLKSAIAELTDETNQGRAFSFLPLSWSMGSVIAPLIGGFLAKPGQRFPGIFGSLSLFIQFPYLLPCMAGAGITLLGWLVGFFFLEESLGHEQPKSTFISSRHNDGPSSSGPSERPVHSEPVPQVPTQHLSAKEILADEYVRKVLTSYTFLALVTVSIDAVLVLWLFTPLADGGIGFTTAQIGLTLSSIGILATLVNLFIFPPLQLNFGTVVVYRACFVIQAIIVGLFPIIRITALAEHRAQESRITGSGPFEAVLSGPGPVTKVAVGIMVIFKSLGGMIFACNMILVNRASPSRMSLGAVNGLAQMVASAMRACGPTIATVFFALSVDPKYNVMKGQLSLLYLLVLAFGGIFFSLRVQEGRGAAASADPI